MAIGNILGYLAGAYENLHKLFPFMETRACNAFCADLKVWFFFWVLLFIILSTFTLLYVEDIPVTSPESKSQVSCLLRQLGWCIQWIAEINVDADGSNGNQPGCLVPILPLRHGLD
ncbi:sucrose transport protein SUC2-like [Trifolium pratense]|uniref:Sucrose transport protein SUC2-like n=1 Tax=Trifolium pratense TaxID=57577 RepID=A0A2K3JQH3_TRIPR|nr:sucrose transport protein SUC2-like [Trifolium pratense]